MISHFSCVWLFATLLTLACQAPLSMGFSRQEYWNGLPCPPPGDLPNPGIEPMSLMSPALAGGFFFFFFLPLAPPENPVNTSIITKLSFLWWKHLRSTLSNFGQHIKKQRHYFADKGLSTQSYCFPSSRVWMWELDYKESWVWRIDALNCGVREESWESLGLQGDQTSPSWRKTVLNIYWKDWCWSWNSITLATWYAELTHLKRPWCWERLKVGEEGVGRGWDGWMATRTQSACIWASSGSWWWAGKPGVLQSMGSQISDMTDQLNWTEQTGEGPWKGYESASQEKVKFNHGPRPAVTISWGSHGKESVCYAGDPGSIPRSGRSPGERNGNLLQYSCLENPMDKGVWQSSVLGSLRVGLHWAMNIFTFKARSSVELKYQLVLQSLCRRQPQTHIG